MRLERLDLICYGCFQGKPISFPPDKADLHIIFGPNEAGKSTALNAIEDLLFGIPKNTRFNFLFDNKDLRIGATLQNEGKANSLTLRRKKGTKDTILDEQGKPLPTNILNEFLHGIDRSFFERMFSLGHERLRQGGKAILEEKDDIGRTLFSASAGLLGLGNVLTRFEGEADQIWAQRKSGQRLYYQAHERYEDAEKRKRDSTVLTRYWKEVRGRLDKITENHEAKNREYGEKTALQEKLQRIRRILPYLGQIKRLENDIGTLGDVSHFAPNAAVLLEEAVGDLNRADAALQTLAEQIAEIQKDLESINPNKEILEQEKNIKNLEKDRTIVEKHERDIPNRQNEIDVLETRRHDLAAELGWEPENIKRDNFFPQTLVLEIEGLMGKKQTLETRLESARERLSEAESRHQLLLEEKAQLGEIPNKNTLETALRQLRAKGNLQTELKRIQGEIVRLTRVLEGSLQRLKPWEGSVEHLEKLTAPQVETIERFKEELSDLAASQKEVSKDRERVQDQLSECKLQKDQLLRDKQAVAHEELEVARHTRDSGWNIIRRQYIEGHEVPEKEVTRFTNDMRISEAFEKSVKDADSVADSRFTHAEETAQLAEISRTAEKLEHRHEVLRRKEEELQVQETALSKQWHAQWADCGFIPLGPEEMVNWIEGRNAVLTDYDRILDCRREEESLKNGIEEVRALLVKGLKNVREQTDMLNEQTLHVLVEHAETVKSEIERKLARSEEHRKQITAVKTQWDQAKEKFEKLEQENQEWESSWNDALQTAGFSSDSSFQNVEFYLTAIKEIKENGVEISKIRTTRIETMQRDITRFRENVGKLLKNLNMSQGEKEDKETIDYLVERLNEERRSKSKKEEKLTQLETLKNREIEQKGLREDALARLQPLLEAAETEELPVLRQRISDSDKMIALEQKKEEILSDLIKQGDGKNREELEKECTGQDSDQVEAQLSVLGNELSELNEELQHLAEQKIQAGAEMENISGNADAAAAEADRQVALADMGDSANRYVRLRTAAILLRWGMERFRKEKQGPMLKRAAEIFKVLTLNNFLKLTVELDDNDDLFLAGIRANDTRVGVEGMSDGTVDQLYFALRLAAIEEYVQKSPPLPFVADDLFINYDDSRATAGFKCLADLAKKTQVLFFTHHEHLLNVTGQALSSDQFVVHNLSVA